MLSQDQIKKILEKIEVTMSLGEARVLTFLSNVRPVT